MTETRSSDSKPLPVSVVIPMRNSPAALRLCLKALRGQKLPRDDFEIIVVDNDSETDLTEVKAEFPEVRWLFETGSSSYAARNRGVSAAVGEIVAFTDSDCIPEPDWLSNAVADLTSSSATILGGKIVYISPEGRSLNLPEVLEESLFGMGNQRRLIEVSGFAVTANLVTYRKVFERVGNFDASLRSSGDREWSQRATAKGEVLRYCDRMLVRHPRRSTVRRIARKQRRIVGGRVTLFRRRPQPWGEILKQFYNQSCFDHKLYLKAWRNPQITNPLTRLRFFALIFWIGCVTVAEKTRIFLGGTGIRD